MSYGVALAVSFRGCRDRSRPARIGLAPESRSSGDRILHAEKPTLLSSRNQTGRKATTLLLKRSCFHAICNVFEKLVFRSGYGFASLRRGGPGSASAGAQYKKRTSRPDY